MILEAKKIMSEINQTKMGFPPERNIKEESMPHQNFMAVIVQICVLDQNEINGTRYQCWHDGLEDGRA